MNLQVNQPLSGYQAELARQLIDNTHSVRRHEMIRVRKSAKPEVTILSVKHTTRGKKLVFYFPKNGIASSVDMKDSPPFTAFTLRAYEKVVRHLDFANNKFLQQAVPELRKFLYSGDVVERTDKVLYTEDRMAVSGPVVYAQPIVKVLNVVPRPVVDSEDQEVPYTFKFLLQDGTTVFNKTSRQPMLEMRVNLDKAIFYYIENDYGEHTEVTDANDAHYFDKARIYVATTL